MPNRPHVVLSAAASIDGYIDDATERRLLLSNNEDFDRVDDVRTSVDAILVGANTIRQDNPRLLVRSQERHHRRVAAGLPFSPTKVTITSTGILSPDAGFFTEGDVDNLIYTSALDKASAALGEVATVIEATDLHAVLRDLGNRGIERLMVEGGTTMHTQFLTAGLADELHLVVAPFFVGDPAVARFVAPGNFPHNSARRMDLTEVRQVGDVVCCVISWRGLPMTDHDDRYWLEQAIDLSRSCPPLETAFSVGAIILDASGQIMSTGYSRETGLRDHAEEIAINRIAADDQRLPGATIYSTLEPCSKRASHPRTCTELIIAAGIARVVLAWREPSIFVDCEGVELLTAAGLEVTEYPDLADAVRQINGHLFV